MNASQYATLALTCCCLTGCLPIPNTYYFARATTGIIKRHGVPVENAEVTVSSEFNNARISVFTDRLGRFATAAIRQARSVALMWGISLLAPRLQLPASVRLTTCLAIVTAAVVFGAGGLLSFRRARTTVNPTTPEAASSLVSSGLNRITRNPMYVGLGLLLIAWAVFLSSAWALLIPVAFVLYMNRFQIAPEERALAKLFGAKYASYKASVRRWL